MTPSQNRFAENQCDGTVANPDITEPRASSPAPNINPSSDTGDDPEIASNQHPDVHDFP